MKPENQKRKLFAREEILYGTLGLLVVSSIILNVPQDQIVWGVISIMVISQIADIAIAIYAKVSKEKVTESISKINPKKLVIVPRPRTENRKAS